jgi:hypothetical protein
METEDERRVQLTWKKWDVAYSSQERDEII